MIEGRRRFLFAAAAICVVVAIGAPVLAPELVVLARGAQPLATALLALAAATARPPLAPDYQRLVTAALLAWLVSDVLLVLPADPFPAALSAAALGALLAAAAFGTQCGVLRERAAIVPYAAVATGVLFLALPAVGGLLRVAVVGWMLALSIMAAQGASWLLGQPASASARLAAFGAGSLVASGTLLVLDRFVAFVPARDLLVLAPHWLGLALLALSVQRPSPALRV